MCRLTVYKGRNLLIGDLIVRPENSLMQQSRDAGYHPGVDMTKEVGKRNIRVNGDGFGVAWYRYDPTQKDSGCEHKEGTPLPVIPTAHCFKFITPAWSNSNLRSLGNAVMSHLIIGHIRAASNGYQPAPCSPSTGGTPSAFQCMQHRLEMQYRAERDKDIVNEENCHPFKYRHWMFAHNGGIANFSQMKRSLINQLDDEVYLGLTGTTDSEHMFALFLSLLPPNTKDCPFRDVQVIIDTLEKTIATVNHLVKVAAQRQHVGANSAIQINLCSSLNIVVTDGTHVVACRYRSGNSGRYVLFERRTAFFSFRLYFDQIYTHYI